MVLAADGQDLIVGSSLQAISLQKLKDGAADFLQLEEMRKRACSIHILQGEFALVDRNLTRPMTICTTEVWSLLETSCASSMQQEVSLSQSGKSSIPCAGHHLPHTLHFLSQDRQGKPAVHFLKVRAQPEVDCMIKSRSISYDNGVQSMICRHCSCIWTSPALVGHLST